MNDSILAKHQEKIVAVCVGVDLRTLMVKRGTFSIPLDNSRTVEFMSPKNTKVILDKDVILAIEVGE